MHAIAAGESVHGSSGDYQLTAPSAGWNRLDPGTLGAEDTDLELLTSNELASIVVRVRKGSNLTLDDFVTFRRGNVIKAGIQEYEERRYFLGDGNLIPVSMARYVSEGHNFSRVYLVMTAVTARGGIEIVGSFPSTPEWEGEVEALLNSLQIDEGGILP